MKRINRFNGVFFRVKILLRCDWFFEQSWSLFWLIDIELKIIVSRKERRYLYLWFFPYINVDCLKLKAPRLQWKRQTFLWPINVRTLNPSLNKGFNCDFWKAFNDNCNILIKLLIPLNLSLSKTSYRNCPQSQIASLKPNFIFQRSRQNIKIKRNRKKLSRKYKYRKTLISLLFN